MSDTKEKIMQAALRLFSQDGYEAVPVSEIAGALGMTKGALYKHFKNKRDIFDCIVQRMCEIDRERSRTYEVPEHQYADSPQEYAQLSARSIRAFTLERFKFWTEDEFAAAFRRMLTVEQYRSEEMQALYSGCITAGPAAYMEDIFAGMLREGTLVGNDPKLLAAEYYGPFVLLIGIAETTHSVEQAERMLRLHIDRFFSAHGLGLE